MADDPRRSAMAAVELDSTGLSITESAAKQLLVAADRKDPLRVLLAHEDRAVELFVRAINSDEYATIGGEARAVLAALREVAGL